MMIFRSDLSPCLLILLVIAIGLGGNDNVEANDGFLSGLKNLFDRKASYVKLAEILHSRIDSNKPEHNTQQAGALLNEIEHTTQDVTQEFKDLVRSFSQLKGSDDGHLCEPNNIKNLRLVAEAMQRGGNLRPKKITEPIRRLNSVVIELVKPARSICFNRLDEEWSSFEYERKAGLISGNSLQRVYNLRQLPTKSLFGNGETEQIEQLSIKLSEIIAVEQMVAHDIDPMSSMKTQIERIVVKPCDEFMKLDSVVSVLEPYTDLLVAAHIIEPNMMIMYKFYENVNELPRLKKLRHDSFIINYVYAYRACTIFKSMNIRRLVNLVQRAHR